MSEPVTTNDENWENKEGSRADYGGMHTWLSKYHSTFTNTRQITHYAQRPASLVLFLFFCASILIQTNLIKKGSMKIIRKPAKGSKKTDTTIPITTGAKLTIANGGCFLPF